MPSSWGMRMSMSTTSGRCRSTAPSTPRPSSASPTTSMRSAPASIIRSPERTSASSSTSRTRTLSVTRDQGRVARRTKSPAPSGPCSSSPPASATRSARPDEAGAGAGDGERRGRGDADGPAADHLDDERGAGARRDRHLDGGSRCVLAGVRQPLLHDAVGRAPERGGERRVVRDVDPRSARACPAQARLLDEGGDLGERRLRRLGGRLGRALAQHADHLAQLLERRVRARADHRRGLGDLLGRRVAVELERPGVQAQERDAVGEDVVHLARDAQPLGLARLLDAQALLALQARGALAQREHELALDAHEQPPADDDGGDEHAEDDLRRVVAVARIDQRKGRRRDQCQAGDGEDHPPRGAQRGVEQGQQRGPAGRGRHDRRDAGRDADGHGVRAPPPQRDVRRRADHEVDDERRGAVVVPRRDQDEPADGRRDEVHEDVDDPVAHGAPAVDAAQLAGQQHPLPARQRHVVLRLARHGPDSVRTRWGADPRPKSTRPSTTGRGGGVPSPPNLWP